MSRGGEIKSTQQRLKPQKWLISIPSKWLRHLKFEPCFLTDCENFIASVTDSQRSLSTGWFTLEGAARVNFIWNLGHELADSLQRAEVSWPLEWGPKLIRWFMTEAWWYPSSHLTAVSQSITTLLLSDKSHVDGKYVARVTLYLFDFSAVRSSHRSHQLWQHNERSAAGGSIEYWVMDYNNQRLRGSDEKKGPIVKKLVTSFLLKRRSFPPPDCMADCVSHLVIPLKHTCTAPSRLPSRCTRRLPLLLSRPPHSPHSFSWPPFIPPSTPPPSLCLG